jgi:thioredoxin reductase
MNYAYLYSYLGLAEIRGTEFSVRARAQEAMAGAALPEFAVTAVQAEGEVVTVDPAGGAVLAAEYVVLAEGKTPAPARPLGLAEDERGIRPKAEGRASRPLSGA